jgi:hypothetical protein
MKCGEVQHWLLAWDEEEQSAGTRAAWETERRKTWGRKITTCHQFNSTPHQPGKAPPVYDLQQAHP